MRFSDIAQQLNTAIPSSPVANSTNELLKRSHGGLIASKVITLNVNNNTQSLNCFQLTGTVLLKKLYALVTTKTTLANLTVGSFDLYDSTAAVQLTKADGVLSGVAVGTFIYKGAANTVTWVKNDNVAGALGDASVVAFYECTITQKTAANTYIRFTYTSTDAPIAATMTVYAEYEPIGTSTLIAV